MPDSLGMGSKLRRRFSRQLLAYMPTKIRHELIRRSVYYKTELPKELRFKIAETQEELERAYSILHDAYVEQGFDDPQSSGMRITKYFALPSTTTLIATWNGEVVATLSVVRRTAMGLPLENTFDISDICEGGSKVVAEVSALAISKSFRGSRGETLLPLCKFFWEFTTRYMNLDRIVIAVNPSISDFYESILLFKKISGKTLPSNFVKGAPAVGLWFDFEDVVKEGKRVYDHRPLEHNAFHYFIKTKISNFEFPDREYVKSCDPVMTPSMLDYFFNQRSEVFKNISENDSAVLWGAYPLQKYAEVLPASHRQSRKSVRYPVHIRATSRSDVLSIYRVLDVSPMGLCVSGPLETREHFELDIAVSETKRAKLKVKVQWRNENGNLMGLQIVSHNQVWEDFVNYLNADFAQLLALKQIR